MTVSPARSRLIVLGTGIALVRHVTYEAMEFIKQADVVFHLTPSPAVAYWLRRLNSNSESLVGFYSEERDRRESYEDMARHVVNALPKSARLVCFAAYGHPGIGAYPTHRAIQLAREEGYEARMLPGISADACMVADLGLNPLDTGWHQLEASDFVYLARTPDTSAALVLWQAGLVGVSAGWASDEAHGPGLVALRDVLQLYYPPNHEVVVYEAAALPVEGPRVHRTTIGGLAEAPVSPVSTLYVPPLRQSARRVRPV